MRLRFFGKDPVDEFWAWFEQHRSDIATTQPSMATLQQVGQRLQKIHRDLAFQIGQIDGVWAIELSAGGLRAMIPTVEKVVAAAPHIPGWKVVAFRQRSPEPGAVQMDGGRLAMEDIRFTAVRSGSKLDIVLYIRGLQGDHDRNKLGMAFLLLDNLLGEYDVMTRIDEIQFEPLPADGSEAQLQPFEELRGFVDSLKS